MGSFDGGGKTISNVCIDNNESNNIGFFGFVQGISKKNKTEIKNVVLENVSVKGGLRTGGLIGRCGNYITINNILVKGLVQIDGIREVGAVVGAECRHIANI